MLVAILAVSSASLAVSTATCICALIVAKRADEQVEQLKAKANQANQNLRHALRDLEF